jgi:hypothetical protein
METIRGVGLISILGMHRSGTSALAGALHRLGADLGPPSAWLQPAADNPRGFFEYEPVVDLNREMLAALGGTWSSPPALPPGWVYDERLADFHHRAEELSKDIPGKMVVKDPRLSLLQPLWEEVADVPASVLCLRHPTAVAHSLNMRNEFTIDEGLFLWFRYMAAALINRPDALLVEYELLLEDPEPQLNRVADHIGLEVSEQTVKAAARTVYREMAHHEGADLPDTPIGVVCGQLYELLGSGERLEADNSLRVWARLVTELPWAGPSDHEISRVRREIRQLETVIDRLKDDKSQLDRRLRRLEQELRYALRMVDVVSIAESADQLRIQVSDL